MSAPKRYGSPLVWALGSLLLSIVLAVGIFRAFGPGEDDGFEPFPRLDPDLASFRVYVLGGSTPMGAPYSERTDFGRIASHLMGDELQGKPIEVINRAKSARDARAALNQAKLILRHEPDLRSTAAFVYTGNNEWLKYDQDHDLSKTERRLCDVPILPADELEASYAAYEEVLDEIVTLLQAEGVFVVLSTLASNLADWEPNRSVLADPGRAAEVRAWVEEFHRLQSLPGAERGAVRPLLERMVEEVPEFAYGWYLLGQELRRLGEFDGARAALQRANDLDLRPDRGTSRQDAIVRRVAERHGVAVVDARGLIQAAARDGLPGYDLFWDNVHPRLEGHLIVAREFARIVSEHYGEGLARPDTTAADLERVFGIDADQLNVILAWEASYHYVTSTYIFTPAKRLAEAERLLLLALEHAPEDADLWFSRGIVSAMLERREEACSFFRKAHRLDRELYERRIVNVSVEELLRRSGISDPLECR